MEQHQNTKLYWANVCLLIRMEQQYLNQAVEEWRKISGETIEISYMGDTATVPIRKKLIEETTNGRFEADAVVTTRFDLFCSKKFLSGELDQYAPLSGSLPLREEYTVSGIIHPRGMVHPILAVPHAIVCNTDRVSSGNYPESLKDLLHPEWESEIVIGDPALPSGKCFLFTMWYLFGDKGLEKIVQNTVAKSAPSAARFSIMKNEFKLAILPEIFAGPTQKENLTRIIPEEGVPSLPSYLAVKKNTVEKLLPFCKKYLFSEKLQEQYVKQGLLIPSLDNLNLPESISEIKESMLFPNWNWIEERDMDYFERQCERVRLA